MERKALIDTLELVQPALSSNKLTPILSHFWFMGGNVMAYNDHIAIRTQFKFDSDIKAAVPETLLSLLKASRAAKIEAELERSKEEGEDETYALRIKAASTKFKLPVLPPEDFKTLFKMPAMEESEHLRVEHKAFLKGIEDCLASVSTDSARIDNTGITLFFEDEVLHLYATNDVTVTEVRLPWKGKAPAFGKRAILSGDFCRQMLRVAARGKAWEVSVNKEYALMHSGEVWLYGSLVHSDNPMNFAGIMQQHVNEAVGKSLVQIPTKLELMLDRAIIIEGGNPDNSTHAWVQDGRLRLTSNGLGGHVSDSTQIDERHKDTPKVRVSPKHLKQGYGRFEKIAMTERCIIMSKKGTTYLIAVRGA